MCGVYDGSRVSRRSIRFGDANRSEPGGTLQFNATSCEEECEMGAIKVRGRNGIIRDEVGVALCDGEAMIVPIQR
jgi:hypothetical protein